LPPGTPTPHAGAIGRLSIRVTLILLLLGLELLPFVRWFHPLLQTALAIQVLTVFLAVLLAMNLMGSQRPWRLTAAQFAALPVRWPMLAWHAVAVVLWAALSWALVQHPQHFLVAGLLLVTWYCAWITVTLLALLAIVPPRLFIDFLHSTGNPWFTVPLAAVLSTALVWLIYVVDDFLNPWSANLLGSITASIVIFLLKLFVHDVTWNPATLDIGTSRYTVTMAFVCTGIEGVLMMIAFGCVWLALNRRELRFPQALLLVPAAAIVTFLLNSVRLAALILIGHAGAPDLAEGGFHAQTGWVLFAVVAIGLPLAGRLPWFSRAERAPAEAVSRNPVSAYLMPFLVILAAGMIARAATSGFEWLYPLRFFAALTVLWIYRREYARMAWRFDGVAMLIGAAVFIMWIALDRWMGHGANDPVFAAGLAALPRVGRVAWLVVRTAAASLTVPIAEELAFRGFVLRRLIGANFEAVSWKAFTWLSFVASSVMFGALHGNRWIAGTVAGMFYALAMRRRGHIGDAAAAHGATNALLAAWVLTRHELWLW
jgi:exosortase E/protease (VPEID-CTERM system)